MPARIRSSRRKSDPDRARPCEPGPGTSGRTPTKRPEADDFGEWLVAQAGALSPNFEFER